MRMQIGCGLLRVQRRPGRPGTTFFSSRAWRPRSRRAVGVGDVAGERRTRAQGGRVVQRRRRRRACRHTRRTTLRSCHCALRSRTRSTGARERLRRLWPTPTRAGRRFGLTLRRSVTRRRASGSDWAPVGACAGHGCPSRRENGDGLGVQRRPGLESPHLLGRGGSPRSRRAVGVGDVAGERRDRAAYLRRGARSREIPSGSSNLPPQMSNTSNPPEAVDPGTASRPDRGCAGCFETSSEFFDSSRHELRETLRRWGYGGRRGQFLHTRPWEPGARSSRRRRTAWTLRVRTGSRASSGVAIWGAGPRSRRAVGVGRTDPALNDDPGALRRCCHLRTPSSRLVRWWLPTRACSRRPVTRS